MCGCIVCPECKGTGTAWYDRKGVYLGRRRIDDFDDLGDCPTCEGQGYDICHECCQDEEDRREGY